MARKVISQSESEIKKKLENSVGSQLTDTEYATIAIMHDARMARTDLCRFNNYVLKEEKSQKSIVTAPHQELLFDFVWNHPLVVVRLPIGTGKTYCMGALTLFLLGSDVTTRGAVVGASQSQSKKLLLFVKDYIEKPSLNVSLNLVFPKLVLSSEYANTQDRITIERPAGIRDPSLVAVGIDGKIEGARLSWIVADDLINAINAMTKEQREKSQEVFIGRLYSRLDHGQGGRCVVCNTPWHHDDLTYYLENKMSWPTITMDIYGYIRFSNIDAAWLNGALEKYIRPATTKYGKWYRLKAHDPDPEEKIPLWPERYSLKLIEDIRYGKNTDGKNRIAGMPTKEFARLFLCQPLDDNAARCNKDWIENCKFRGIKTSMVAEYKGDNPTYTGLDLAVGKGKKSDKTVFFTIELLKDGSRRILDIESGHFLGPDIIDKIIDKENRYKSICWVENNAAQDFILQFALEKKKDLKIRAHTTTSANKNDVDWGVESIFTEIEQQAWIIPCNEDGTVHEEIKDWIDDMLYYQPSAHTGDHLMASWICRQGVRKGGRFKVSPVLGKMRDFVAQIGGF